METTPELEAVAFAIFCAGGFHPDDIANGTAAKMWASNEWPDSVRKAHRQARAALLAIRPTTEGMEEAADDPFWSAMTTAKARAEAFGARLGYGSCEFSIPMWQAMIDHILAAPTSPKGSP